MPIRTLLLASTMAPLPKAEALVSALGSNTTGSNNTAFGNGADVSSGALTNASAFGSGAIVTASNSIQLGNATVTEVRAGTSTTVTLVAGGLKITGGTLGVGKVLTSDATGVATWQTAGGGGGWGLTGTAGTADATSFIGTTDDIPFNIRVNNQKAGKIDHLIGNTFYGYQAGNTTTGNSNTASGFYALRSNTTGFNNTASGWRALLFNTTGNNNTASGFQALYNNTGGENTASGLNALFLNTTGSGNTAFGFGADVSSGALTNASAFGSGAIVTASNNMMFGNSSVVGWGFGVAPTGVAIKVGTCTSNGNGANLTLAGAWTSTSDSTKKHDIINIAYGLNEVMKLRPVNYKWKGNNQNDFGFLAQEVKLILPEIVYGEEGQMTISYGQITSVLVKAMQEQQQLIENLMAEISKLKENDSSKAALIGKLETENTLLKTSLESRLSKMEQMLGAKAQK